MPLRVSSGVILGDNYKGDTLIVFVASEQGRACGVQSTFDALISIMRSQTSKLKTILSMTDMIPEKSVLVVIL